jgi:hypothetical protein
MTSNTRALPSINSRRTFTPKHVDLACYPIQVIRIGTGSIPAQVIGLKTTWSWSPQEFPYNLMNFTGLAFKCHHAVTAGHVSWPFPTTSRQRSWFINDQTTQNI